ncbi:hypothetical protein I4I73_17025 [Pseudonocardia sp. KRD-184]|uniref:Uncharacterized protein n=1 Tax=Pseudonocardia oceani TaxID=2792013 RepID=A0ABS6U9W7_9PSEU|nr:hypothetical protein [Pseudonocardia oceani]MBW0090480.1 hypothetical protein [Pseudonocardia oceani]MBW0097684.1 hypothetical protein [Pseudonocardia oceani]MBW0110233.1 hypothetical protein [Pseudonocardia oceani]MBW0124346.1 hypothetical protein [Pseudonocardia oceani]MBW0129037.1 hypothetical protein [Pseudonocardia oceani]
MSGVTARPPRPPAPAAPSRTFEAACRRVVDHLRRHAPLAFWSVSRHVDDQQVHLHVHDEFYGMSSGHAQPWSESFCRHVVDVAAPCIAPDVREVPEFAGTAGIGA